MKRDLKDKRHIEWSKAVRSRDNSKCIACGKKTKWCNAHHMDSYDWAVSLRFEVSNGVTLCSGRNGCHTDFHKKYGNKNNTRSQFAEYLMVYHGKKFGDLKL